MKPEDPEGAGAIGVETGRVIGIATGVVNEVVGEVTGEVTGVGNPPGFKHCGDWIGTHCLF